MHADVEGRLGGMGRGRGNPPRARRSQPIALCGRRRFKFPRSGVRAIAGLLSRKSRKETAAPRPGLGSVSAVSDRTDAVMWRWTARLRWEMATGLVLSCALTDFPSHLQHRFGWSRVPPRRAICSSVPRSCPAAVRRCCVSRPERYDVWSHRDRGLERRWASTLSQVPGRGVTRRYGRRLRPR